MKHKLAWIGIDWGTTNLRVFALSDSGDLIDEKQSDQGMNSLKPEDFEKILINLIEPWLNSNRVVKVYACGMVGARQGWREANYRSIPCRPISSIGLTDVTTSDPRIEVKILPGISQSSPADVMRGEETQIAGVLSKDPQFSGIICLPGTHSKWVSMKDGEVIRFSTFMTGELFSLISSKSVLRHSVAENGEDKEAFIETAFRSAQDPNLTVKSMFSLRAKSLLENQKPNVARARLSGMIIGQEIGVAKDFWKGQPVTIIGALPISKLYAEVLGKFGVSVRLIDAKTATLSGLMNIADELNVPALSG